MQNLVDVDKMCRIKARGRKSSDKTPTDSQAPSGDSRRRAFNCLLPTT